MPYGISCPMVLSLEFGVVSLRTRLLCLLAAGLGGA